MLAVHVGRIHKGTVAMLNPSTAAAAESRMSLPRLLLLGTVLLLSEVGSTVAPPPIDLRQLGAHIDSLLADEFTAGTESLLIEGLQAAEAAYGAEDHRIASWLVRAGGVYRRLSRYNEAEEALHRAEAIENERGPTGREGALAAMRILHEVYVARKSLPAAAQNAQRCLDLSQESYGRDDPRTAMGIWMLAQVEMMHERDTAAAELLDAAIALLDDYTGPDRKHLAGILTDRARIARDADKSNQAMALYKRAYAAAVREWGPEHPKVISPLLGQAILTRRSGDFSEAEVTIRRCLTIRERASGPRHPQMAHILNSLGLVLGARGKYDDAAEAYRRSLDVTVSAFGERHSDAANTMVNLANSLMGVGEVAESIRLRRKALAITEEIHGSESTLTAFAVGSLARAARARGNHREAEVHFRRSLQITERIHGWPYSDAAVYRREVGRSLLDQGRLAEAREFLERAVAEATEIHGATHYKVARSERYLGILLLAQDDVAAGRKILEKSQRSLEAQYGPHHPALLTTLYYLALGALWEREDEAARDYASRCLAIADAAAGAVHRNLVRALRLGLLIDVETGRAEQAVAKGMRACEIALAIQDDIYQVSSEQEAIAYAQLPNRTVGRLLGAVQRAHPVADTTLARVFSLTAQTHGQVLDRLAQRWRCLERSADSSRVAELHRSFVAASARLANLILRGTSQNVPAHQEEVQCARREKEAAERALAEMSELFRSEVEDQQWQRQVTADNLARALPPGAALIHFVRFPPLTRSPAKSFEQRPRDEPYLWINEDACYAAFCLRATADAAFDLRFVDLGDAVPIDSLIALYRDTIDRLGPGQAPSARDEADFRAVSRSLHEHIWTPLVEESAPPIVFIIPASQLNLIDFNTLLAPSGQLTIEQGKVHLCSSGRDLLRAARRTSQPASGRLLAVGNPAISPHSEIARGFAPLPGAEAEAHTLARQYSAATQDSVTVLTGAEATEGAITALLPRSHIAHLATHGFFWESGAAAATENPLLRSGLLLAPGPDGEDGILTAQELTGYDLRGVEWVVLSACGSGLGQLLPGEGVAGLRRAFEIAGARSVLMALWRIGDRTTADLMERIYRHRLAGASTIDAVRLAELERLREERSRRNRIHPARWGGIVAEGDWR